MVQEVTAFQMNVSLQKDSSVSKDHCDLLEPFQIYSKPEVQFLVSGRIKSKTKHSSILPQKSSAPDTSLCSSPLMCTWGRCAEMLLEQNLLLTTLPSLMGVSHCVFTS